MNINEFLKKHGQMVNEEKETDKERALRAVKKAFFDTMLPYTKSADMAIIMDDHLNREFPELKSGKINSNGGPGTKELNELNKFVTNELTPTVEKAIDQMGEEIAAKAVSTVNKLRKIVR